MSLDNSSLLVGAAVGAAAIIVLGKSSKKGGSGKSTRRKGLGSTYVVEGRAKKVTGKRATATRKASGTAPKRRKKATAKK